MTDRATVTLHSVQSGVAPDAQTISAGLEVQLAPGWKTYWRSPGEVGLPPELSWAGSANIADIHLSYPAPTRFSAFDIENFGYEEAVVFPLQVVLETPGQAAEIALKVDLLLCADVCVLDSFTPTLTLPNAVGQDAAAAGLLGTWLAKVPDETEKSELTVTQAGLAGDTLVIEATSETGFRAPDIFPELGYAAFGKPEITISGDAHTLVASLPIFGKEEAPLSVTLVDGAQAVTQVVPLGVPPSLPSGSGLWLALGFALLGGLILNVMPCVLPVLSIKLTSALKVAGQGRGQVRRSFLITSLGVLAFFWVLAATLIGLKTMGAAVGWGVQFQSPVFLSLVIVILTLFAANLFGLYEISLPGGAMTKLASIGGSKGVVADFSTGALAALLTTPCSAPFLGTAVTYALSRGPVEIGLIFTALGIGLALPYLVVAARPALVSYLPKPGAWMEKLRWAMGALLLVTVMWFLSVLAATGGSTLALYVAGIVTFVMALLKLRRSAVQVSLAAVVVATFAGIVFAHTERATPETSVWQQFDPNAVAQQVAAGHVVFVDVTAAWCLTCKVNKTVVLERGEVAQALEQTVRLQADWTRPNEVIHAFLQENGRFGIPFNIVYGPNAPDGIALPEVLTSQAVLDALKEAGT